MLSCCLLVLIAAPWHVNPGDNVAAVMNDVLHINELAARDTKLYASASRKVEIEETHPWQVDLMFKFGEVRNAGTSITLRTGSNATIWFGEDSVYGALTFFNGTDQIWHKPADSHWHSFIAWSDGSRARIFLDGEQIAITTVKRIPEWLTVESRAPKAGRQTELSVTNVHSYNVGQPNLQIFGG